MLCGVVLCGVVLCLCCEQSQRCALESDLRSAARELEVAVGEHSLTKDRLEQAIAERNSMLENLSRGAPGSGDQVTLPQPVKRSC